MKDPLTQAAVYMCGLPKKTLWDALDLCLSMQNAKAERQEAGLAARLKSRGWRPVQDKPKDREFYVIRGEYWVQDPEAHKQEVERAQAEQKKRAKTTRTPQRAMAGGMKRTAIPCPVCGAGTYRERVCPGCREGRAGFVLRLICEENVDHEVLL